MQKRYSADQSPLYRLLSKRKLLSLLRWAGTPAELKRFLACEDNYRSIQRNGRDIKRPALRLKLLQRRLREFLIRIDVPDYLHSGREGRSHITNALVHNNGLPAIKVDIKKFFASTTREHVYRWFRFQMQCSPDVSDLLSSLGCYRDKYLSIGPCTSEPLAFHVHRKMFDRIEKLAIELSGTLTVYVDDIVISMPSVDQRCLRRLTGIVAQHGLTAHKEKLYRTGAYKVVTGVVLKNGGMYAQNKLHLRLHEAVTDYLSVNKSNPQRKVLAQKALGTANAIAQIDVARRAFAKKLQLVLAAGIN